MKYAAFSSRALRPQPAQLRPHGHVLQHRAPGKQRHPLKHHSPLRVRPRDPLLIQVHTARIRRIQPAHDVQKRRFAALSRPQQHQKFFVRYRQIDVPQYLGHRAAGAGKSFPNMLGNDFAAYIAISRFHGQILFSR